MAVTRDAEYVVRQTCRSNSEFTGTRTGRRIFKGFTRGFISKKKFLADIRGLVTGNQYGYVPLRPGKKRRHLDRVPRRMKEG